MDEDILGNCRYNEFKAPLTQTDIVSSDEFSYPLNKVLIILGRTESSSEFNKINVDSLVE